MRVRSFSRFLTYACALIVSAFPSAAVAAPLEVQISLKPPSEPRELAGLCSRSGYQYPDFAEGDPSAVHPESCKCEKLTAAGSFYDRCVVGTAVPTAESAAISLIIRPSYPMFSGPFTDGIEVVLPTPQATFGTRASIIARADAPELDISAHQTYVETERNPPPNEKDLAMLFALFKSAWRSYRDTTGDHPRAVHLVDMAIAYRYLAYSRWIFIRQGWQINDDKNKLIEWLSARPQNLKQALGVRDLSGRWEKEIVDFFPREEGWIRLGWAYRYMSQQNWPPKSACSWGAAFSKQTFAAFGDDPEATALARTKLRIAEGDIKTLDRLCNAYASP